MSQDQWIILLLKIVLVSGAVSVAAFVVQYHRLAKWWKNPIGRTIVIKDILLIACLTPSILSLFLQFNRLTSHIAAWTDIVLFGLLTPVMAHRILIWQRVHRDKQAQEAPKGDSDEVP